VLTKTDTQKVKRIQKLDLDILESLYKYRALSTAQIRKMFNLSKMYTYKKMRILQNTGWVHKAWIKGFAAPQRKKRQGVYFRIGETGIACLRKQGYPVERKASQLRVSENFLPYLLSTNDLMIDLMSFGWRMLDSREVKRKYSLNRGDSLQGILTSPGDKEYVFYMLMEKTTKPTLTKIAQEMESYSALDATKGERPIPHYIIFVRGQESYQQVNNFFNSRTGAITSSGQIKVMPLFFAKMYFRLFDDKKELLKYLSRFGIEDVTARANLTQIKSYNGLSTVVRHEGEEKYFVNLLDSDLIKMHDIHSYRKEQYELDGRKMLAITTNALINKQQEMLQAIKHIDWYPLDHHEMIDYLSQVPPTD